MYNFFKRTVSAVFVLLVCTSLFAETFRVRKVSSVNLSGDSLKSESAELKISDALAIFLPEDQTYLEGIELTVQIPKIVADWRDSVAVSIYNGVNPMPGATQIDYNGTKIFVTPLPTKFTWILQIPLTENFTPSTDDGYISSINTIPDTSNGFVFLRFQPAMKGVPDEVYDSVLNVSAKPILKNKGTLKLSVQNLQGENVSSEILIDDAPVNLKNGKILLTPGIRTLSVQNSEYRNEVRSIVIERAKTTEVSLTLKSSEPTIIVSAPDGTRIFLDDQPFTKTNKEIPISEGEHKIRFLIGGYEMTRSLEIQNGKSYKVNLTIDLEISDE
ncbi:MAG: PEGA domain-containing protein [Treponema sp.]|nr:PEGA domain-containing protein [Treponema sp.]